MKIKGLDKVLHYPAKWLYKRFGLSARVRRELAFLYPTVSQEEREEKYLQNKLKACLLVALGGIALIAVCLAAGKESVPAPISYPRGEYGDENRLIRLLADAEGSQTEVELMLPSRELTEAEAIDRLSFAEKTLYQAMMALGKLETIPELPDEVEDVEVVFYSRSPELLDDSFRLTGDWPEEESTVCVEAVFSIGGYTSHAVYEWTLLAARELPLSRKMELLAEKLLRGDFNDDEQMTLPTEGPGGLQISWFTQKEGVDPWLLGVVLLILTVIFWLYRDEKLTEKRKKALEAVKAELPHMIYGMILLLGAGMSVPNAWFHYAGTNTVLEKEILRTKEAYEGGKSFTCLLQEFSERVAVKEVSALCSLLTTAQRLGNARLIQNLREMNRTLWQDKKDDAKTKAAKADTRLLLPIMMMLIVIVAVVMTPAIMDMKALGG